MSFLISVHLVSLIPHVEFLALVKVFFLYRQFFNLMFLGEDKHYKFIYSHFDDVTLLDISAPALKMTKLALEWTNILDEVKQLI